MHLENTIIWEKWSDPFGEESDDYHFQNILEPDNEDYQQQWPEENQEKIRNIPKAVKVISTPMGIIPINDNTASGKIFNFWVGHTNFNITKKIVSIIEDTQGVECLDIFTRYRFRIAIGKAFSDAEIMNSIQNNIYEHLNNDC
jgi:hypothetical protein